MLHRTRGYTIVEILVVISIMGILAGIGIASWGSYINWSSDRARESDTRTWVETFETYRSRYFSYPVMPTSSSVATATCLGGATSFPTSAGASFGGSKCGQYKSNTSTSFATATSTISTALTKVSNLPKNSHEDSGRTIVEGALVGPIIYVTQSADSGAIPVTARFINFFKGGCPSGFTESTNVATDFPLLSTLKPTGSDPGSSAKVCYIQKTFTYTPIL